MSTLGDFAALLSMICCLVSSRFQMSLEVKLTLEEMDVATWSRTFVSSPDNEFSMSILKKTSLVRIPIANMHVFRSASFVLTEESRSVLE